MAERTEPYHHGNLKAVLIKAAFQVIGKLGVDGLTLREIARRAGVSHNAPYRHFKSKEDLLAALATDSLRQLTGSVREAVDAESQQNLRLRAAARAYLEYALKNPARFSLTFHAAFDRESYPEYVVAYTDSLALLAELIQVHLKDVDTELASELIWSSIHGISELGLAKRLRHGDRKQLEELADVSVATLLAGLRSAS
jgi:AcrR family transcriptional regulator